MNNDLIEVLNRIEKMLSKMFEEFKNDKKQSDELTKRLLMLIDERIDLFKKDDSSDKKWNRVGVILSSLFVAWIVIYGALCVTGIIDIERKR